MTEQPALTVQQADALWDAVAIPGPTRPTFMEQHQRVCAVVADLLAEATAPREPAVIEDNTPPGMAS